MQVLVFPAVFTSWLNWSLYGTYRFPHLNLMISDTFQVCLKNKHDVRLLTTGCWPWETSREEFVAYVLNAKQAGAKIRAASLTATKQQAEGEQGMD
jgi:hypothetical protein